MGAVVWWFQAAGQGAALCGLPEGRGAGNQGRQTKVAKERALWRPVPGLHRPLDCVHRLYI